MDKKTDRWYADHEMSRGWTGTSKVNMDEQKTATMQFPMPSWLHDIKRQLSCLKNTAAGLAVDVNDARSTAVSTVMESVSPPMTPEEHAAWAAQRAQAAHAAHAARAAQRAHADHAAHAAHAAHDAHADHTRHADHTSHDAHADHTAHADHIAQD